MHKSQINAYGICARRAGGAPRAGLRPVPLPITQTLTGRLQRLESVRAAPAFIGNREGWSRLALSRGGLGRSSSEVVQWLSGHNIRSAAAALCIRESAVRRFISGTATAVRERALLSVLKYGHATLWRICGTAYDTGE